MKEKILQLIYEVIDVLNTQLPKEEYIEKAIYISKNLEKLDYYRDKLFHEILSSPLFDVNKFADEFLKKLDYIFNQHKN